MRFTSATLQFLKDMIRVGDDRLADHIKQQIESIRDALVSADALERERIQAIKETALDRVVAQESALKQLEVTNQRRFESLEAAAASHLTSDEYDRRHQVLEQRIADLENWRANLIGRYVGIAAIGMVAVAVAAGFLTHLVS